MGEAGKKNIAGNSLHRWMVWFDAQSLRELVEEVKRMDTAIMTADEKQTFVMQSEDARDYYERRQKAEWDRISGLNEARREGENRILDFLDKGYATEAIRRELANADIT